MSAKLRQLDNVIVLMCTRAIITQLGVHFGAKRQLFSNLYACVIELRTQLAAKNLLRNR